MVGLSRGFVRSLGVLSFVCGAGLALSGCGGDRPADLASVEAAAKPPGVAACSRWQTCVPENPCHTGWVTGCRGNVPICTDIGGWLSNGTACGVDHVCNMGECTYCPGNQSCAPPGADACTLGAISCATGQAVCEPAGPADDGTPCGDPTNAFVCQGGTCTCVQDRPCTPYLNACATGRMVCWSPTSGYCQQTGTAPNGTPCGNGICNGGWCMACGSWCQSPNPCYGSGALSCTTGACQPAGDPYPNGWACGADGETCTDGVCSGAPGARLVLRTISGIPMDVTDTVWSECYGNEPSPGMSRLATDTFGVGTFTHKDVVYTSSLACTGPTDPALGVDVTALTQSYGDRIVGWDLGAPPMLPSTVTATAVLLSGIDPGSGLPETMRTLFFVNDYGTPQFLHMGKGAEGPDGFPLTLSTSGRPRLQSAANVLVRTASGGFLDLTGTTWVACFQNEPVPGQSRRATDVYDLGAVTHTEETYPSSADCTGAPGESWTVTGSLAILGDRTVGWTNGMPPVPGLPYSVVATAIVISGTDSRTGLPVSFRDLRFVDDWYASPRALYQGNVDGPIAPDGFPAQLANEPAREPAACVPGVRCLNPVNACEISTVDCTTGASVCVGTGTFASDGTLCGPANICRSGACVATQLQTVTGSRTITFWPEAGAESPQPYGNDVGQTVTIRIRDVLGATYGFSGTIGFDGTFAIPDVPAGAYYRLLFFSNGVAYGVGADAAAFDLGFDEIGRAANWGSGMNVDLTVNGMEEWVSADLLEVFSGNVPFSIRPFGAPSSNGVTPGAIAWTAPVSIASAPLVDPMVDVVRVHQAAQRTLTDGTAYLATARAGTISGAALLAGGSTTWTADLADPGVIGTFTSAWPAASYESRVPEINPAATLLNNKIGVTAVPHVEPLAPTMPGGYMGTPGVPLLIARAGAGFAGTTFEGAEFRRFLPSPWTEYRDVRISARVALSASNGSRANFIASISRTEPLDGAPPADAEPLVTPPLAVTVNDAPATTELIAVGTAPVIRWSAPAVGAPTSYVTRVYRMENPGPGMTLVAQVRGASRAFPIPGGVLMPGQAYFAVVEARLAPAEQLSAPLRYAFAGGFADAVTAPFSP